MSNQETIQNLLPDKPSDLVRLALRDMEAAEKSPLYRVDHGAWHRPPYYYLSLDSEGPCTVCYAGSIMAWTLGADRLRDLTPSDFDYDTNCKLQAVDALREGLVDLACRRMGVCDCPVDDALIAHYFVSPDSFKRDQRQLANKLEAAGF